MITGQRSQLLSQPMKANFIAVQYVTHGKFPVVDKNLMKIIMSEVRHLNTVLGNYHVFSSEFISN